MLERLIYRSRASWPAPQFAVEGILGVSVARNAGAGITGVLGFSGDSYVQLLEGPGSALTALMRTLEADARHRDLDLLYRQETPGRLLAGWSLAKADLTAASPKAHVLLAHRDGLALTTLLTNLVHGGATVRI